MYSIGNAASITLFACPKIWNISWWYLRNPLFPWLRLVSYWSIRPFHLQPGLICPNLLLQRHYHSIVPLVDRRSPFFQSCTGRSWCDSQCSWQSSYPIKFIWNQYVLPATKYSPHSIVGILCCRLRIKFVDWCRYLAYLQEYRRGSRIYVYKQSFSFLSYEELSSWWEQCYKRKSPLCYSLASNIQT